MRQKAPHRYTYQELAAFCVQISLLLEAAVPLAEGLAIMSEDAQTQEEKELLIQLAERLDLGVPLSNAMDETAAFPDYVVQMTDLGQETGTLDQTMHSLAEYYEKEHALFQNIKNTITYPIILVLMLMVVLFVLFTKVMPVFEEVYEQLGAQISPAAKMAIQLGGVCSGVALGAFVLLALITGTVAMIGKTGRKIRALESLTDWIKCRNKVAVMTAVRRFTSTAGLILKCGFSLEKGLELSERLVDNRIVRDKLRECEENLGAGDDYYEALKKTGLFGGIQLQMIQVGNRSGKLDSVMEKIARDCENQAEQMIEHRIDGFEPMIVAILAIAVGTVLLSVMLPLAGAIAALG